MGLQPDRGAKESTFAKETQTPLPPPPEIGQESGRKLARQAPKDHASRGEAPEAAAAPQPRKSAAKDIGGAIAAEIKSGTREQVRLNIDGREVNLTHLNKEYFPADEVTKRDVLAYYASVAQFMLPFLKDRPLVLHRYPNGIDGGAFYQKEAGEHIPDWVRTVNIYSETKKHDVAYFLIDDLASLLYLTNLGCIEHNPFSARADDLEKPDYMFVDLDPTEGTAFSRVMRAAKVMGEVLSQAKLKFFLKTSGATGLHIFIPIARNYGFDQIRALLEIMTMMAVEREKGLLTRIHRVNDRPKNTVFVDVRQNAYAQSLAAIFSLRPRQGAPVSTPLGWSELKAGLKPEDWNIRTVLEDLPQRGKVWKTFFERPQTLEQALAALERSRSK
jgi:bifunctional non-homologous end joining protein LigD